MINSQGHIDLLRPQPWEEYHPLHEAMYGREPVSIDQIFRAHFGEPPPALVLGSGLVWLLIALTIMFVVLILRSAHVKFPKSENG